MVSRTHGNLAEDAAAYLTKGPNTTESLSGDPKEIDDQAARLVEWAQRRKVVLNNAYTANLEKHNSTTAEHEIFYRASDNRAVKRTYPGTFGVTNDQKGKQHHATPLFYLRRLQLMNRVFSSDLHLEGMAFGKSLFIGDQGERPCMVISQPWIDAADENNPHPSEAEIATFMESLGFSPLKDSYFGWSREDDGITIIDARPDNFIKSVAGVVPIDLVVSQEPDR